MTHKALSAKREARRLDRKARRTEKRLNFKSQVAHRYRSWAKKHHQMALALGANPMLMRNVLAAPPPKADPCPT